MDAREDLPKVSVETHQDWRRIQHNLTAALFACLDAELKSNGQSEDKEALLPHAHQFLETVFDIARPNLRINGRTTDEAPGDVENMEPFDEALDRHIWSLSDQRLKWDKEIANRRRSRPVDIEKLVAENMAQHYACNNSEVLEMSSGDAGVCLQQVDRELHQALFNTVALAPQLLQSTGYQRDRANRIKSVSAEVRALKP